MAYGGKVANLKTERRDKLDGGLDSRKSPIADTPDSHTTATNLAFTTEGSARVRKSENLFGASLYPASNTDLPAPSATDLGGGGTIGAGNYEFRYRLRTPGGTTGFVSTGVTIAVGAASSVRIDIACNNLGEAQGQGADGADDPFNGNIQPANANRPEVWVRKTTDTNWQVQTALTWTWVPASRVQRATVTSYSAGATTLPAFGGTTFPLRHLVWHPGIQLVVAVVLDRAGFFPANLAGALVAYAALAKDKSGNNTVFSRCQTRMRAAYLNQIMVLSDGLSKPKKLNWTGTTTTSSWRVVGATEPTSSQKPTLATNGAGALTGVYSYAVTYIYSTTRADGTTVTVESNPYLDSDGRGSAQITLAAQQVRVTIPANNDEAGISERRLYRTKAGGSLYYWHSTFDQAASLVSTTFDDNVADTELDTNTVPPGQGDDNPDHDTPPAKLVHLTEHQSRLWAFNSNYILDDSTNLRIIDYLPTNELYHTIPSDAGGSEDIDCWPADEVVLCGDSTPPTGMVSHNGDLIVFKANSIGKVVGNSEDDYVYVTTLTGIGAMRNSMISAMGRVFFWEDARGPFEFDGYREKFIGYDIQQTWMDYAATGFRPYCVWFNREINSVVWQLTTVTTSPPGAQSGLTGEWVEFAYYLPTGAWTLRSGVDAGLILNVTSYTECVTAANIATQLSTPIFGTYSGETYQDNYSYSSTQTAQFTLTAFFGDGAWDMIKLPRFLELIYDTGGTGSTWTILVEAAAIHNPTFKTVESLTQASGYHLAGRSEDGYTKGNILTRHVRKLIIPSDLLINLRLDDTADTSVGPKLETDWSFTFRFTLTGNVQIHGASFKYEDVSDIQKREWPGT